jgi:hypothetical protein
MPGHSARQARARSRQAETRKVHQGSAAGGAGVLLRSEHPADSAASALDPPHQDLRRGIRRVGWTRCRRDLGRSPYRGRACRRPAHEGEGGRPASEALHPRGVRFRYAHVWPGRPEQGWSVRAIRRRRWPGRCAVTQFDEFPHPTMPTLPHNLFVIAGRVGMPALERCWQDVPGNSLPPRSPHLRPPRRGRRQGPQIPPYQGPSRPPLTSATLRLGRVSSRGPRAEPSTPPPPAGPFRRPCSNDARFTPTPTPARRGTRARRRD